MSAAVFLTGVLPVATGEVVLMGKKKKRWWRDATESKAGEAVPLPYRSGWRVWAAHAYFSPLVQPIGHNSGPASCEQSLLQGPIPNPFNT